MQRKISRRDFLRGSAAAAAVAILPFQASALAEAEEEVTFKTVESGTYAGLPLFDANPDHLEAYLDTLCEYYGNEGMARVAARCRGDYTLENGSVIPGALRWGENVTGVSTQFGSTTTLGITWNKELINTVGTIEGYELLNKADLYNTDEAEAGADYMSVDSGLTRMSCAPMSDIRVNPLMGRYAESTGEDTYLASVVTDQISRGLSGIDDEESEDGFWIKNLALSKHITAQDSEWYRGVTNNSVSMRSIMEYHLKVAEKMNESGAMNGILTAYGRINGINAMGYPVFTRYLRENSKYGLYTTVDLGGDWQAISDPDTESISFFTVTNYMSNGYMMSYFSDPKDFYSLMMLSQAAGSEENRGTDTTYLELIIEAAEQGYMGLTWEDIEEIARQELTVAIRLGIFNERDENGLPIGYPWAEYTVGGAQEGLYNSTNEDSQEVARQYADEAIVLLKNDGTLPLSEDASLAVAGIYADTRYTCSYASGDTNAEGAATTALQEIVAIAGEDKVSYDLGEKVVALKSAETGLYLTVGEDGAFTVDGAEIGEAQQFVLYDWGQNNYSLKSVANGQFLNSYSTEEEETVSYYSSSGPSAGDQLGATSEVTVSLTGTDSVASSLPNRFYVNEVADGNVVLSQFTSSTSSSTYSGNLFVVKDNGLYVDEESITSTPTAEDTFDSTAEFVKEVVTETGADAAALAEQYDTAILFVGQAAGNHEGEGTDRVTLYIADTDYELVDTYAAAFAAAGKTTVVVICSEGPVIAEAIQNNDNVNAVLYWPYGGQYEALGLTDILYGYANPSGHLSGTWYSDMSMLGIRDEYCYAEGVKDTVETGDDTYTTDMTIADPESYGLTYQYYAGDAVTYEFGYGLSYSDFSYENVVIPESASADAPFSVSVDVTNNSEIDGQDVVQVYIHNAESVYGDAVAIKKLVGFEKVNIPAGETVTVTVEIDPADFAQHDVNASEYVVESGVYDVYVGTSSANFYGEGQIQISGSDISALNAFEEFGVFLHSYSGSNVVYLEANRQQTIDSQINDEVFTDLSAVMSKYEGAYVALANVDLTGAASVTATVATNAEAGTISLHLDSPDGEAIATLDVPVTEPVTYTIENTETEWTELGYEAVTADLSESADGVHNIYIVFEGPKLRIDKMQFNA